MLLNMQIRSALIWFSDFSMDTTYTTQAITTRSYGKKHFLLQSNMMHKEKGKGKGRNIYGHGIFVMDIWKIQTMDGQTRWLEQRNCTI